MKARLKETITFNNITFNKGTSIFLDKSKLELLKNMDDDDFLVVKINPGYHSVKALVKKAQIKTTK